MSTPRSKLGLQYKINLTYASVIESAVTFLDGKVRSVGMNGVDARRARFGGLRCGDNELLVSNVATFDLVFDGSQGTDVGEIDTHDRHPRFGLGTGHECRVVARYRHN